MLRAEMNFRQTLRRHLDAIQARNLDELAATVAADSLVLIMADGKLVRSTQEFLEAHRNWFAMQNWTLQAHEVELFESAELGVALLRLDYREPPSVRSESFLTLVFQRRDGKWLMVQDQNTPIR
jgi:ketosteroid isomerase-like protein